MCVFKKKFSQKEVYKFCLIKCKISPWEAPPDSEAPGKGAGERRGGGRWEAWEKADFLSFQWPLKWLGLLSFLKLEFFLKISFYLKNLSKQKKLKTRGASKLGWTEPKFLFLKACTSWGPGSTLPLYHPLPGSIESKATKEEPAVGAMNGRELPNNRRPALALLRLREGVYFPGSSFGLVCLLLFWRFSG